MKSMIRRAIRMSALYAGLVAFAPPAMAQGRSRDVPPGIAKKDRCPPGLAKQGRCYDGDRRYGDRRYDDDRRYGGDDRRYDISRQGSDWCWDRNHDARCDVGNDDRRQAGVFYDARLGVYRDNRGNIYDRNGRIIGRMNDRGNIYDRDGRVVSRDGRVYDRNGRVIDTGRDDIRSTVGELIQRAQEIAAGRR